MKLLTFFVLFLLLLSASYAQSSKVRPTYSPADAIVVARCVIDNCADWTTRKVFDKGSAQVGFSQNGMRYTLFAVMKSTPTEMAGDIVSLIDGYVSFWVRPEGTKIQTGLDTFTIKYTSFVTLGIDSRHRRTFDFDKSIGLQHQNYWQALSNQAISATQAYIDSHPVRK